MYQLTGFIGEIYLKAMAKKKPITFENAVRKQEEIFRSLIAKAELTKFGVDNNFSNSLSIKTYQSNTKCRDYSDFWKEYWKDDFPNLVNITWPGKIPYFAKTSGTSTGKSKYIPCTKDMVKANNRAGLQVLVEHFKNAPRSKILRGRYFMFAGSPNLEVLSDKVYAGELSGISAKETPKWAGKDRYYPPKKLAQIKDWTLKLNTLSKDCLNKNIRAISGLPSWLQILFLKIFNDNSEKQSTLKKYFPKLELIVHGGMSFEPYYDYFQSITNHTNIDFREIYAASEGFFAISDRNYGDGMKLIVDNQIFYEFIRLDQFYQKNPKRLWLNNVENDVDYVLLVSTSAGLWSYIVGDIIKFKDHKNLRILFSGRLSQTLSMFGEKVLNEEVELSIAKALKSLGLTLKDFTVFSSFKKNDNSKGFHTYLIEIKEINEGIEQELSELIDKNLMNTNSGYNTRRKNNINMIQPNVIIGKDGLFEEWMKFKNKSGGQNKVPRVINKKLFDELMEINNS